MATDFLSPKPKYDSEIAVFAVWAFGGGLKKSGGNIPLCLGMPRSAYDDYKYWKAMETRLTVEVLRLETLPLGFLETLSNRHNAIKQKYKALALCNIGMIKYKIEGLAQRGEDDD